MKAIIQKTDSDGVKSTFTIVGLDEEDIEKQIYELEAFARRDSTYPDSTYQIIDYGNK